MYKRFTRREFVKVTAGLGTITTFLPTTLLFARSKTPKAEAVRMLGRTNWQATTLGLGGQASLQWTKEGIDPVRLILKAIDSGINYIDTSNVYGPSQLNIGKAFKKLNLIPGQPNYNEKLRKSLFIASKTHMRYANHEGRDSGLNSNSDGSWVKNALDDVKRSLSQIFGDGNGNYPKGTYLDSVQIHNIQTFKHVDAIYMGLDNPDPKAGPIGALAGLLDLRDGTNKTGLNPKNEKLIKHIGITGHWSSPAHMYAIQRDTGNIIDTLLVAINANDRLYLNHQYNVIPVAKAKRMGIVGMKIFADGLFYGKSPKFSRTPQDVILSVGSKEMPSDFLIQYSLSIPGVNTLIIGIGNERQLTANLQAAQLQEPLSETERRKIEQRAGKILGGKTNYFQMPPIDLTPPRNVNVEVEPSYSPDIKVIRISWHTAYAGNEPIVGYEVLKDGKAFKWFDFIPQTTLDPYIAIDKMTDKEKHRYEVRVKDRSGNEKISSAVLV